MYTKNWLLIIGIYSHMVLIPLINDEITDSKCFLHFRDKPISLSNIFGEDFPGFSHFSIISLAWKLVI